MINDSKKAFYDSLPRKRSAVGVLIIQNDKLLVLEPTYKSNWLIPGGVVEKFESPYEAVIRECHEEIGADVKIRSFLCADYKRGNDEIGDAIHFLFLGELPVHSEIKINQEEIKSFQWLSSDEALLKFDEHLSKRVEVGLQSLRENRTFYIEDGLSLF